MLVMRAGTECPSPAGSCSPQPRLEFSVGWGSLGPVLDDGSCRADPACRPPPQQERLKAQEQRVEMEEKVSKRSLEATGKAGLAAAGPGLLPRKPPGLSTGPTGAYGKAMSPPPSPRASPVAALKAKVIQKLEDVSKPPAYAYPATPSSHPSSPPPASPPPTPGIARKEEAPENVVEKKDLELEKEAPSPFQALFSGRSWGNGCPVRHSLIGSAGRSPFPVERLPCWLSHEIPSGVLAKPVRGLLSSSGTSCQPSSLESSLGCRSGEMGVMLEVGPEFRRPCSEH